MKAESLNKTVINDCLYPPNYIMRYNIHAGHSLKCRGASGLLDEVNEDRKVKNRVITLLREMGHVVYDCTDDNGKDQNSNLKAIVSKCNAHKVDLDVSIHLNAGGGTGTEVYIYSDNSKAKDEAERIVKNISNTLGIRNRGVKTSTKLYVLRKTNSPALLIECCFVDNATDKEHWNVEKCARAIVEGVTDSTLHVSVQQPASQPAPSVNIEQLAHDVINGKYGTGDDRKRALGANYSAVQKRVNELLGAKPKQSVNIDDLARRVMNGEFGNGAERKRKLGGNYKAVQERVNQLVKGK